MQRLSPAIDLSYSYMCPHHGLNTYIKYIITVPFIHKKLNHREKVTIVNILPLTRKINTYKSNQNWNLILKWTHKYKYIIISLLLLICEGTKDLRKKNYWLTLLSKLDLHFQVLHQCLHKISPFLQDLQHPQYL